MPSVRMFRVGITLMYPQLRLDTNLRYSLPRWSGEFVKVSFYLDNLEYFGFLFLDRLLVPLSLQYNWKFIPAFKFLVKDNRVTLVVDERVYGTIEVSLWAAYDIKSS